MAQKHVPHAQVCGFQDPPSRELLRVRIPKMICTGKMIEFGVGGEKMRPK